MMAPKYLLLTIFFSVNTFYLKAQTREDSLLVVQTKWSEKEIKKGVVWKHAHYSGLFKSQQEVNIVEVDLRNRHITLGLEGFADTLFLTSAIASKTGVTVAINGGFFDIKNGGGTTLVKKNGKIINYTTLLDKAGRRTERSNGALLLQGKRTAIVDGNITNNNWDEKLKAKNILVCGPLLLLNGLPTYLLTNPFNDNRHPRSAVAITKDKKLLLITTDGRNAQAQGMNLHELAFFLKMYGAREALNLDGGGSTTLYIKNEGDSGIVNYPSDNKLFDHEGERKVANALLIY